MDLIEIQDIINGIELIIKEIENEENDIISKEY